MDHVSLPTSSGVAKSAGKSSALGHHDGTSCNARQNQILAALPSPDLCALVDNLELVSLPFGAELFTPGQKPPYVYFPTTAIAALLYVMADGATTEIAVIGREGMVGMGLFLGERSTTTATVQTEGYAFRMRTAVLREAFNKGGGLPHVLMQYSTALFAQLAQNTVSSLHASIEQKLSRWLLDRVDRSESNELKVTQVMISLMLGVRRESITAAAQKLQAAGLIECHRGIILVANRAGLEHQAGECYEVAKAAGGLLTPPGEI